MFFSNGKMIENAFLANECYNKNNKKFASVKFCRKKENVKEDYFYRLLFNQTNDNFLIKSNTKNIFIGEKVKKFFPDEFACLQFINDSFNFRLDEFYSDSLRYFKKDDNNNNNNKFRVETYVNCCLNVARNLLEKTNEVFKYVCVLAIHPVTLADCNKFRNEGYPVNIEDFLIEKVYLRSYKKEVVAFVKIQHNILILDTYSNPYPCGIGEIFVLPYKSKENLCKKAFCEDFVKKFYPAKVDE